MSAFLLYPSVVPEDGQASESRRKAASKGIILAQRPGTKHQRRGEEGLSLVVKPMQNFLERCLAKGGVGWLAGEDEDEDEDEDEVDGDDVMP
jgi:hypothetical protein